MSGDVRWQQERYYSTRSPSLLLGANAAGILTKQNWEQTICDLSAAEESVGADCGCLTGSGSSPSSFRTAASQAALYCS